MGYFCINLDEDTKENLIRTIRNNLNLYERAESGHSYLLDEFIQGDLDKLIVISKAEEKSVQLKEANETSKG